MVFLDVISWCFLFIGVNGASFVRSSGDIWVTGCNYVESVTFVQKCTNISLRGSWMKLCWICTFFCSVRGECVFRIVSRSHLRCLRRKYTNFIVP